MKVVVMFLLTILYLFGNSEDQIQKYYNELHRLSNEERFNLHFSYAMGYKENIGLTLAAIAWKESYFGRYPMNLEDGKYGSYGLFHILLEYSLKRNNKSGSWDKSRLAEKLIKDNIFAAEEAIGILKHFSSKNNCNWRCTVASYNAGNLGLKSKKGINYVNDISLRVKAIDRYFTTYGLYYKLEPLDIKTKIKDPK